MKKEEIDETVSLFKELLNERELYEKDTPLHIQNAFKGFLKEYVSYQDFVASLRPSLPYGCIQDIDEVYPNNEFYDDYVKVLNEILEVKYQNSKYTFAPRECYQDETEYKNFQEKFDPPRQDDGSFSLTRYTYTGILVSECFMLDKLLPSVRERLLEIDDQGPEYFVLYYLNDETYNRIFRTKFEKGRDRVFDFGAGAGSSWLCLDLNFLEEHHFKIPKIDYQ